MVAVLMWLISWLVVNQSAVSCDIGLCGSSIDVVNQSAVSCDIGLCGSSIDVVNQLAGG